MYLAHTPTIVQKLFGLFTWQGQARGKRVYLTFDDGPIPEVTPWVLDVLAEYDARATFFCVGENVGRYPTLFRRLLNDGHAVGNHTHNHLSGWDTDVDAYLANVDACADLVESRLFRPPYGRLSPRKAYRLRQDYRIVMWDVLSGDFDTDLTGRECTRNVLDNVRPGSIIVFHDSLKAEANLRYALPRVLGALHRQGYCFEALSQYAQAGSAQVGSAQAGGSKAGGLTHSPAPGANPARAAS